MKRIILIACTAGLFAACSSSTTTETNEDTLVTVPAPDTVTAVVYTPVEGDVIYKDGKVMVMHNGEWVETDRTVTLENGVVVDKKGEAKKDNVVIKMDDGEVVTKTGDFFDRTGHAIDNAWQDTKDAVEDAGKAVGKTFDKLGKKIDTAFDKNK